MDRIITHSCGHAECHVVVGYWVADRDREAARLARGKCTSCAADVGRIAAAKAERAARARLGSLPLSRLSGSPRQAAWAETIRLQQLAALHRVAPDVVGQAARVTDARWWIDHRSDTAARLVVLVATQVDLATGAMPHAYS